MPSQSPQPISPQSPQEEKEKPKKKLEDISLREFIQGFFEPKEMIWMGISAFFGLQLTGLFIGDDPFLDDLVIDGASCASPIVFGLSRMLFTKLHSPKLGLIMACIDTVAYWAVAFVLLRAYFA